MKIDMRIADAIQVIGAIAENDLSPGDLDDLDVTLSHLVRFVRMISLAKRYRIKGYIQQALDRERISDDEYDALPANCKW